MASFRFTVDTNPMAQEMKSVSHGVTGATAAIVGMKVAVLKAESDAANDVCNKVNRGFYTLIHSQLSQKIVKLASEVDSLCMKLKQQRKQLLDLRDRMGRDYDQILKRYSKVFDMLNRSLKHDIFAVDRPLIDFCVRDMERVSNRPMHLTATAPLMQEESISESQKMIVADFKQRCLAALRIMGDFLEEMKRQNELTKRILLPMPINQESETHAVPVIVYESNFDNSGNTQVQVAGSGWLSPKELESVRSDVMQRPDLVWNPSQPDSEVRCEFSRLLSRSGVNDRVKQMAESLFARSPYSTLKTTRQ